MNKFLPVINHLTQAYKKWYEYSDSFPKKSRYTLAAKIDSLFIELMELLFTASYQKPESKLSTIENAIKKIDLLKLFLQISWEIKALDNKKFIVLSTQIQELGRMVGGWRKGLLRKTPI